MTSRKRSMAKTATFRILATATTIAVVWVFTGNVIISAGAGILDSVSKVFIYYFHERAWERVSWGR